MNYLAHIFLARQSDDAMLGALLGDFVRGDFAGLYGPEIETEIAIHRKVDSFTDAHPALRDAKRLFESPRRRFAGITLDIFYDHMLARHWASYSAMPLDTFIGRFYDALARNGHRLPDPLDRIAPRMIEQDWLGSYRDFSGVEDAVNRVSTRLSKNGHLMREGLADLRANYDAIATGFPGLFADLTAFVGQHRAFLESPQTQRKALPAAE
jgi:acyl carrier protein phosphodiesterase